MKTLLLLLLPCAALAGDPSWSTSYSHAHAQASAQAGAVAGAYSGGNTLTVGAYQEEKQAPAVFAPNVAPTAPCMGGTSAGGSGTGFGLSFGTSWTDDECNTRETARLFHAMNLRADALAILCSSAYAAAAPSCAGRARAACHADAIVAQRLGVEVCP